MVSPLSSSINEWRPFFSIESHKAAQVFPIGGVRDGPAQRALPIDLIKPRWFKNTPECVQNNMHRRRPLSPIHIGKVRCTDSRGLDRATNCCLDDCSNRRRGIFGRFVEILAARNIYNECIRLWLEHLDSAGINDPLSIYNSNANTDLRETNLLDLFDSCTLGQVRYRVGQG